MQELDIVKLNKEFKGLKAGTEGTIVLEYDSNYFEVEFFDDNNDTIGVFTTPAELLDFIKSVQLSPIQNELNILHRITKECDSLS